MSPERVAARHPQLSRLREKRRPSLGPLQEAVPPYFVIPSPRVRLGRALSALRSVTPFSGWIAAHPMLAPSQGLRLTNTLQPSLPGGVGVVPTQRSAVHREPHTTFLGQPFNWPHD